MKVLLLLTLLSCRRRSWLELNVADHKLLGKNALVLLYLDLRTGLAAERPILDLIFARVTAARAAHKLGLVAKLETFVHSFSRPRVLARQTIW